jgi:hypothetical protein
MPVRLDSIEDSGPVRLDTIPDEPQITIDQSNWSDFAAKRIAKAREERKTLTGGDLNIHEQAAIMDAYRMAVGLPGVSNVDVNKKSREYIATHQGELTNLARATASKTGKLIPNLVGLVAPEEASRLRKQVEAVYPYDPTRASGVAGELVADAPLFAATGGLGAMAGVFGGEAALETLGQAQETGVEGWKKYAGAAGVGVTTAGSIFAGGKLAEFLGKTLASKIPALSDAMIRSGMKDVSQPLGRILADEAMQAGVSLPPQVVAMVSGQIANNLLAKQTTDPSRKWDEGLGQTAAFAAAFTLGSHVARAGQRAVARPGEVPSGPSWQTQEALAADRVRQTNAKQLQEHYKRRQAEDQQSFEDFLAQPQTETYPFEGGAEPVERPAAPRDIQRQPQVYPVEGGVQELPTAVPTNPRHVALNTEAQKVRGIQQPGPQDITKRQIGTDANGNKIMLVNGDEVKKKFSMDFVEGDNDLHSQFIPKGEIWVDANVGAHEFDNIIAHETTERRLMDEGMNYEQAHKLANERELAAREAGQTALPTEPFPFEGGVGEVEVPTEPSRVGPPAAYQFEGGVEPAAEAPPGPSESGWTPPPPPEEPGPAVPRPVPPAPVLPGGAAVKSPYAPPEKLALPQPKSVVADEAKINKTPEGRGFGLPHATYDVATKSQEGPHQNPWIRQSKDLSNKNRVLLVQIGNDLILTDRPRNVADDYYDKIYSKQSGYKRPPDFWELPTWIGQAAHNLPNSDVYVVRNLDEAIKFFNEAKYGEIAFSVMDVNQKYIKQIADAYNGKITVGGYTDFAPFKGNKNVTVQPSIEAWMKAEGKSFKDGADYRHFKDSEVIPRLCLSEGCLHNCKFCVTSKTLTEHDKASIDKQVESFKDLNARLVYINDKTFGQAKNHQEIIEIGQRLKKANPNFEGFVVQTTAAQVKKFTPEFIRDSQIKYWEIGVESYNDPILKEHNKPATEKVIDDAVQKLREAGVKVIPNIMIGLPGETAQTYAHTLDFINRNRDVIAHINTSNVAVYKDSALAKKVGQPTESDSNENILQKSYHTPEEAANAQAFHDALYKMGSDILDQRGATPAPAPQAAPQVAPQAPAVTESAPSPYSVPEPIPPEGPQAPEKAGLASKIASQLKLFNEDQTGAVRADAFLRAMGGEDAVAAAKGMVEAFTSAATDLRKVFAPTTRGPEAAQTTASMRTELARYQRGMDIIGEAYKKSSKFFDRLIATDEGKAIAVDLMDRANRGLGQKPLTPEMAEKSKSLWEKYAGKAGVKELQPVADAMDSLLKATRDEVRNLGTGALEKFFENYFPKQFKRPVDVAKWFEGFRKSMTGSKAFLKHRLDWDLKDAIDAGFEPVTYNPVETMIAKVSEMRKYIAGVNVIKNLETAGVAGRFTSENRPPAGWKEIHQQIGLYQAKNPVTGEVEHGRFWAAPQAADLVNNHLSPGLRGKAWFQAYLGSANWLNQLQLGLSGFHLAFTSGDAVISKIALAVVRGAKYHNVIGAIKDLVSAPLAPVTNALLGSKGLKEWYKPGSVGGQISDIIDIATDAGARAKMNAMYRTHVSDKIMQAWRKGNVLGAVARTLVAPLELPTKFIMDFVVPRQKMGVAMDLIRMEMQQNPNISRDELVAKARKIWDSADNRMGQLVYDNLFWNKLTKDMAMATVRSVGWNLGTFREVLGGALDLAKMPYHLVRGRPVEMTYKASYVIGLVTAHMAMGAILNKIFTGEYPKDMRDFFFPRTGGTDEKGRPSRLSLPDYIKDVYHFGVEPIKTLLNKIHPAITAISEMLHNKDFYGNKIRNEDDPLMQQLKDVALHTVKVAEPLSSRNIRRELKLGESPLAASKSIFGMTPAPVSLSQSDYERSLAEVSAEQMPIGGRTKEAAAKSELKRTVAHAVAKGNVEPLRQAIQQGQLTAEDARQIVKDSKTPALELTLHRVELRAAIDRLHLATKAEKEKARPILIERLRSFADSHTAAETQDMVARFRKNGLIP